MKTSSLKFPQAYQHGKEEIIFLLSRDNLHYAMRQMGYLKQVK